MREIEIKAKVKDKETFLLAISNEGIELPEHVSQNDYIFVLKPFKLYEIIKGSSPILRIREQNGKFTLTLKKDITDQLDCIEHETEVKNGNETELILNELGYHKVIEVKKRRRKFSYNNYKVCVDEVENLGMFVELELVVATDVDVEHVRNEMWDILQKFNISKTNMVTKGYDRLIDELHLK